MGNVNERLTGLVRQKLIGPWKTEEEQRDRLVREGLELINQLEDKASTLDPATLEFRSINELVSSARREITTMLEVDDE